MIKVTRLIAWFWLMVGSATACQAQGWRGIIPLHSTREDVERLIGRPTESNGLTYDLQTETVTVFYSAGVCPKGWPYGWNVKSNVVVKIISYPQTRMTLEQLGFDLRTYVRTTNARLGGADYVNKEVGISIGVKENGDVEVVQYQPGTKEKGLLCPAAAERDREIESGQSTYATPVAHYLKVSPEEEAVRLDFFADQFKKSPSRSKIYIIGYGQNLGCRNEALVRANRAKTYLVKKLKLPLKQVITIDGGFNSAVWVELHIVREGEPQPLSNPDLNPDSITVKDCSKRSKRLRRD